MRGRLSKLVQITLAVALSAAACKPEPIPPPPPAAAETEEKRGGTLVLAQGEDIRTLDPARMADTVSQLTTQLVFDTLLDYPRDAPPSRATLRPGLASSWKTSADGRTLTFEIREAARFSDGRAVLAEDFVYALDRLLAPETTAPMSQFFAGIEGASARLAGKATRTSGLGATGPRTLEIKLERPDPSFPLLLAMTQTTPQKRDHVEAEGASLGSHPLGTGPFRVASFTPGQEIRVERNPFYWDERRPLLDGVRVRLNMPRDAMLLGFLRGELDLLDARICEDALLVAREASWAPYVERTPLFAATTDLMNVRKPPFDDKRVRQAFNYAIDRRDVEKVGNGRIQAANGFLPPGVLGYDDKRPVWPHDPARAKALLAEAGHADGLDVVYTTLRDEMAQKVALSMQADLAAVGVRMRIETLTFPAYLSSLARGDVVFGFSSWAMDFPDPWDFLEVKFHSRMIETGMNDTGYSNPEVDRLLDEARLEPDEAKRVLLYRRAESIILEDCPNVWQYFTMAVDVRQPRVRGPIRHPARDLSFRDTWLEGGK